MGKETVSRLAVNQRDATLADQVKLMVDGKASLVAPGPKPHTDGNVDITISDSTPCPRADVVTFLYEALTQ